jgi:hypothetical protein
MRGKPPGAIASRSVIDSCLVPQVSFQADVADTIDGSDTTYITIAI